jgi:hypothetical protein
MDYQTLNDLFTKLPYEAKILWHRALQSEVTEYELTKLYELSEDKEAASKLYYFIKELNDHSIYISNRSYIEKEVITKYRLPELTTYTVFDSYEEAKDWLRKLDTELETTIDEKLGILSPGTIVYTFDLDGKIKQHIVEFSYFRYGYVEQAWKVLSYCIKNTKTNEITSENADDITLDWKDWLEFEI